MTMSFILKICNLSVSEEELFKGKFVELIKFEGLTKHSMSECFKVSSLLVRQDMKCVMA